MRTKSFLHRFSLSSFVCLALLAFAAMHAQAASTTVVISQVYGAGGNANATYRNDFVELHNVSSPPVSVSLNGMSIQYASATGTGNFTAAALPNITLSPGQYFLVQFKSTAAVGAVLPADYVASPIIDLSGSSGKVALVNGTASLACNGGSNPCSAAASALIVDMVGYGSANFYEGTGPAPTLSSTLSAQRNQNGCADTDSNSADFTAATPAPRNTSSPLQACEWWTGITPVISPNPAVLGSNLTMTYSVSRVCSSLVVDLTPLGGSSAEQFADEGGTGTIFSKTLLVPTQVGKGTKVINGSLTCPGYPLPLPLSSSIDVVAPPIPYAIHEVQGSGNASPVVGDKAEVTGIVVALASNGFYLEAPYAAWDNDPATSEGVFVYTSSAPTVSVGDSVKVVATVQEYGTAPTTVTELASPAVTVLSTGNEMPPVAELLPDPSGRYDQLERYEGMLVHFGASRVVGPSGISGTASNGIFYSVLNGTPRPYREPGVLDGIALPSGMPTNYPVFDRNPERLQVNTSGCTTRASVGVGDTVSEMTGPLSYSGDFTIYACPTITSNQQSATPLPLRGENEFTVASFNMENFTADATRLAKASLAIRNVMGAPDIIGVEEMKDLATIQAVADRVNGDGGLNYAVALVPATSAGAQQLGLLYRQDRVTDVNVQQVGADAMMLAPYATYWLNDRPPLVMTASIVPLVGKKYPVTVIVNHLKSLIDTDVVDIPPAVSGDRTRHKRQQQAEYLANLIKQHEDAGETVIAVGDFNAYDINDGYVDVLGTVTGNPAPADRVLFASPDLYGTSQHPVDLAALLPQNLRYSYVEGGNTQMLDHIVVSPNLLNYAHHLEIAHNNAEYPETLSTDASRPERVSDHDMPVAYFAIPTISPSLFPSSLTFAATMVGYGTGYQKVTFTNSSPAALAVTPTVSGPFLLRYNLCPAIVAPGASCNLMVLYLPQAGGPESGTLSVSYTGGAVPVTAALNGTGIAKIVVGSNALTFAPTDISSGAGAQKIGITNRTGKDITITPVIDTAIAGTFRIATNGCMGTIAPNNGCYLWVNYIATYPGEQTGTLTITPSTGAVETVSLTGTGNPGQIIVGPTAVTYAATKVGYGAGAQKVGILNRTGADITIAYAIDTPIAGSFRVSTNGCGGTLAPNTGCYLWVNYIATATGQQNGTLTITPTGGGTVKTVSLTGTGN